VQNAVNRLLRLHVEEIAALEGKVLGPKRYIGHGF
jgi:putative transposon-encoded protein